MPRRQRHRKTSKGGLILVGAVCLVAVTASAALADDRTESAVPAAAVSPTTSVSTPDSTPFAFPAALTETPQPTATPPPTRQQRIAEVVSFTNKRRVAQGCSAVKLNNALNTAAQKHTEWQTTHGLSHTGANGSTLSQRVDTVGYPWQLLGENVAEGFPDATSVVEGWVTSPGHRENVENCQFTQIGVGVAADDKGRLFWTQVFASPRPPTPTPTTTTPVVPAVAPSSTPENN